jgi:hypothetical protein
MSFAPVPAVGPTFVIVIYVPGTCPLFLSFRFRILLLQTRLALANEYVVKNAGKDLSQRISPSSSFRIFLGTFCSSMIPKCQSTFKFRLSVNHMVYFGRKWQPESLN